MLINLMMSKFPQQTRKEIAKMVEPMLSDIKKSRAYREIAREVRIEQARKIAKTMAKKKMSPKLIVELTGLSPKEVRAISKELAARKN